MERKDKYEMQEDEYKIGNIHEYYELDGAIWEIEIKKNVFENHDKYCGDEDFPIKQDYDYICITRIKAKSQFPISKVCFTMYDVIKTEYTSFNKNMGGYIVDKANHPVDFLTLLHTILTTGKKIEN